MYHLKGSDHDEGVTSMLDPLQPGSVSLQPGSFADLPSLSNSSDISAGRRGADSGWRMTSKDVLKAGSEWQQIGPWELLVHQNRSNECITVP